MEDFYNTIFTLVLIMPITKKIQFNYEFMYAYLLFKMPIKLLRTRNQFIKKYNLSNELI